MSSFQEAVFQNNVLVRQIINHLINGPVILVHIALINKKFNEELCSRLRQIQNLDFYSINNEPSQSDTTESANEKDVQSTSIQYGFNQILGNDLSVFNSNLSFVTHQSPIISLNFQQLTADDGRLKLDHLLQLKGKF